MRLRDCGAWYDIYGSLCIYPETPIKALLSTPGLGWGAIIGNCLDRGFGYTPTGEHSQMQCGMEVVLPDGQLLRTGIGALSSDSTFALYKG